ncbi:transposase, partial [[Clostridium] innocuum]|nr:transposase [[Clostridium] innocuum]MCR0262097.1 transposase [[Clostridium] innocuum]MCR0393300.1 transposase [[Clostridium] innocuum]
RLEECIKAHFLTCFLALLVYRLLEKKLENKYTVETILDTLRQMNVCELEGYGYIPTYKRTDLTDELHNLFGFRTDTQIIKKTKMRNIIKCSKMRDKLR